MRDVFRVQQRQVHFALWMSLRAQMYDGNPSPQISSITRRLRLRRSVRCCTQPIVGHLPRGFKSGECDGDRSCDADFLSSKLISQVITRPQEAVLRSPNRPMCMDVMRRDQLVANNMP